MIKRVLVKLAVGVLASTASLAVHAIDITGAGASFPYPAYAKWAARYHADTGVRVNYQSIGSGGGQQQIIARTVDFGASDDPMDNDAIEANGLLQFPALIGGTVPVINVANIGPGELKLTGPVLADIFLAKITRWDDPAIQELNPDLKLPAQSIIVVHRSDGSGTTFGWTSYLAKVSPDWLETVGVGKAVKWPTGQGGKGNEGVSAYVRQLKNSIGYVEFAYAKQNNLPWAQLQNKSGRFVQPSQETFAAAAAAADWGGTPNMGVILTDEADEDAWPVTSASFILVHKVQKDAETGKQVLKFFDWAYKNGTDIAKELDYVPMPQTVIDQIIETWKTEIKATDGSAVWK